MSISARPRSGAHATKSQLFTFPWGSPREAQTEPEGPIKAGLEHSAVDIIVAALSMPVASDAFCNVSQNKIIVGRSLGREFSVQASRPVIALPRFSVRIGY